MLKQHVQIIEVTPKAVTVQDEFGDTLSVLRYRVVGREPEVGAKAILVKSHDQYRVFVMPEVETRREARDPDQSGVVFVGEMLQSIRAALAG